MKYIKYIVTIIIFIVVGYIIVGVIPDRKFDKNQQLSSEQNTIEIFGKVSSEFDLKFSNYQDAKNYFQEQAGTDHITNFQMYTSLNHSNSVPSLGAVISSNSHKNRCLYGKLNLVTGKFITNEDVCIVYN